MEKIEEEIISGRFVFECLHMEMVVEREGILVSTSPHVMVQRH